MRLRVLPVLIVLAALVAPARVAGADVDRPVGGPLLGRDGMVVHREDGVPKPPKVSASSYVVADAETGEILAAKDPHGRYRPASTLKALTAVTLIPRLERDEKVKPQDEDIAVEGSKVGITTKMRYSVEDLFLGMLLASGNDAALALARAGGGLDRTLNLMNAKADELHAYDTVAKTPNGLDRPDQRSSAYDLALIARAGLDMPAFRDYVSTERAKFPAPDGESFRIANHNDLLTEYEGCLGIKTGYTSKAEATYVGAAEQDGRTLVVSLMHAEPAAWEEDATDLLDWGFSAAGETRPVGTLVEPGPQPSAAATAASRDGESAGPARGVSNSDTVTGRPWDDRPSVLLLAVLGASVIVTGLTVVLIQRRPRRRYEGRHSQRRAR